ncbi:phosphoglycerol transferase [Wenyingzhuangia fucanilytica]|uniref:Phosphoglycerol transferase n=1 Tax=Wenyingzhuangia fucanilytica TaxID=1790137 RepID=A0A1B1Y4V7_9FLAO|nr:LTA synthase family protein [Wenyingzhuangia fucanilytica]ANW95783.1 phosphoglycerol transferase [Wenyingzhuangia fucanilytica]
MKSIKETSKFHQFLEANRTFVGIFSVWLMVLCFVSIGEIIYNGITNEYPKNIVKVGFWSITLNIVFWIKWLFYEYTIYTILFMINKRIAKITAYIFILILAIIHLCLIQYFNTALVPLGADIYSYSIADIKQTLGSAGGVGVLPVIGILIFSALLIFVLHIGYKFLKLPYKVAFLFPIISILLLFVNTNSISQSLKLNSDFENNLVLNKSDFFYKSTYKHFYPEVYEMDIYADSYIGDYEGDEVKILSFEYIDEENYPFLHQNNSPDVLSTFFNKSEKKPNIVIILVEGLGRAFTNKGAYLGNFTPFLDSLSNQSLYWKNFLSQGGRTFAVLPSLMASLPFGENGFLALGDKMPKHLSLFNILNNNGYQTSFYYGGESRFDNMKLFLQLNNVAINDYDSFPSNAVKLPASSTSGFSWGYSDKAMFKHFLNNQKQNDKPSLSVLLTVATHSPFLVEEQDRYNQRFEERLDELNLDEKTKNTRRNYKAQFASVLYADDAVKEFINEYKKRPDFDNTIFLITGDHRLPEIPMATKIDRYHVPLIIYSPMLKRTEMFASVSTHFDIAPSLLSYLKNSYNIKTPSVASWMGDGLDTIRSFRNIHSYPLIQTKTDINDYVLGNYHLNGDNLFELNQNMGEANLQDEDIKNRIQNLFNTFKRKSQSITVDKAIIPDSIYQKYTK